LAHRGGRLLIHIRLTPRGGRDAIDGVAQLADGRGVLKVRVRAAASEGEANAALVSSLPPCLALRPATSPSSQARARGSARAPS